MISAHSFSPCLYLIYGYTWTLGNAAVPTSNITLSYKLSFWCCWDQRSREMLLPNEDGRERICARVWDFRERERESSVQGGSCSIVFRCKYWNSSWQKCIWTRTNHNGYVSISTFHLEWKKMPSFHSLTAPKYLMLFTSYQCSNG